MRILLDTCIFLWLITNDKRLATTALSIIKDTGNSLFLSPISVWEILVKREMNKVALPENAIDFLAAQRALHGINSLPVEEFSVGPVQNMVSPPAYITAKGKPHNDPFDRLIMSQAMSHNMKLFTADFAISLYPAPLEVIYTRDLNPPSALPAVDQAR